MSSGERHSGATVGISIGLALGSLSSMSGLSAIDITFMTIGCLFGLLLSPDADIDTGSIADTYIKSISGRPGLFVWNLLWTPYKIGIKHRSFWSHTPIIGTTVRLLYMVFPCIIILLKDQSSTPILELILRSLVAQLVAIPIVVLVATIVYFIYTNTSFDLVTVGLSLFAGLCVSDFGHFILDL